MGRRIKAELIHHAVLSGKLVIIIIAPHLQLTMSPKLFWIVSYQKVKENSSKAKQKKRNNL